jgi:hypothetical protein
MREEDFSTWVQGDPVLAMPIENAVATVPARGYFISACPVPILQPVVELRGYNEIDPAYARVTVTSTTLTVDLPHNALHWPTTCQSL